MDFLRDDELIVEQYAVGYFNDERLKKQLRNCMPRWLLSKLFVYAYSHAWRSLNNIHADHVITFMPITQ